MTHSLTRRLLLASLAAGVVASTLTACFPLVAGGIASGALLASDRRTSGAQLEDEGIELQIPCVDQCCIDAAGHQRV